MNKLTMVVGAASMLTMSAATFAELELTGAQMDGITAGIGFAYADANAASTGLLGSYSGTTTSATQAKVLVPHPGGPVLADLSLAESGSVAGSFFGVAGSESNGGAIGVGAVSVAVTEAAYAPGVATTSGAAFGGTLHGMTEASSTSFAALAY